ncbi:MAG: hypothetical protein JRM99_01440 [Nitrososphaerota archaeon]|nr:hypothetical protein [Nitrososphaerota archaeon]
MTFVDAPGCTIGAKVFDPGRWFVLFKNKDFKRAKFEDELLIEEDVFGIKGTDAWAATAAGDVSFSGLSLGINSNSLFCADANIKTLARKRNYDVLTELTLRNSRTADEAARFLSREIERGYGWTNVVAADPRSVYALELGRSANAEAGKGFITRTNHFVSTPGSKIDYHQNAGTKTRYSDSYSRLKDARSLSDIFDLLRTHRSMKRGNSICNHGTIHTVYSYVFEMKNGRTSLYVQQGNPCQGGYTRIDIAFPLRARSAQHVLDRYPSRRMKRAASVLARR